MLMYICNECHIGMEDEIETAHLFRLLLPLHVSIMSSTSPRVRNQIRSTPTTKQIGISICGLRRPSGFLRPVVLLSGQLKQELSRLQCRL